MAQQIYADVLARAEARAQVDPEFADLLTELVNIPTGTAGELDHLAAVRVNDQRRREAFDQFRAAALTTAQVQDRLGLATPQAVHRLRSRGRVIGMPVGNHTLFPSWQLSGDALRPDLSRILELLRRFTDDPVVADRVMRLVRDDLGGLSVIAALDRPDVRDRAWTALAELAA
ncbi:MAG: hypothetical protein JO337_02080 [Acidimicrobiales bacterium]|nr:hypothetical protein [Acidimicrobiales bacterium]